MVANWWLRHSQYEAPACIRIHSCTVTQRSERHCYESEVFVRKLIRVNFDHVILCNLLKLLSQKTVDLCCFNVTY